MKMDALEQHIFDTVKEWQIKIGYREEKMELYYPEISLCELLETEKEQLDESLALFCREEKKLGDIKIRKEGERYSIGISAEGCAYIAKEIPDPEFLVRFLKVITNRENTVEQVRACFFHFAKEKGMSCIECDRRAEGLGYVFYFDSEEPDSYVYCVEEGDFGLNYHRFTRKEYEVM